eukprot:gene9674-11860_t
MSYNSGYPGQYSSYPQQPPQQSLDKAPMGGSPAPGVYPNPPPPQQSQTTQYSQQQQQYSQQQYSQQQYSQYPPQQPYGGYPPQGGYPPAGYPPAPSGYPGLSSGAYGAYQTSAYPSYPPPQPYGAYPPTAYGGYGAYPTTVAPAITGVSVPVVTPVAVAPVVADTQYVIHLKGSRLDRKDVFSKSDPFITLSVPRNPLYVRSNMKKDSKKGGGSTANWAVVYRTETIRDNQNPVFAPFTIGLHALCGGNLERPIKIECWDYDANGAHDKIGSGVISVREMQVMKELRLVNKKRLGWGNTAGTIEILKCAPA